MVISRKKRITVWLLWLFFIPAGTLTVIEIYPPVFNENAWDIVAFLILICLLAVIPVTINDVPVTIVQGVSLAVFLVFGLAVDIIVTQIAFLFIVGWLRPAKKEWYRFPLNMITTFFFCSASGLVYYALGGDHDFSSGIDYYDILMILIYQFSYFFFNQVAVSLAHLLLFKKKIDMKATDIVWDAFMSLFIVPIGIILFLLYLEWGTPAILLGGSALVGLAFIMKQYYFTKEINHHLKKASEFGHQLTQRLQVSEVLDTFVEGSSAIIPADYTLIFEIHPDEDIAQSLRYVAHGKQLEDRFQAVSTQGLYSQLFKLERARIYDSKKQWANVINPDDIPEEVESIMAIPFIRNNRIAGEILIASSKRRAYAEYQLKIMELLASYLWIAVENARHYQETKQNSERCALTGLYNFRYFEKALQEEFNRLESGTIDYLSVILIDIDHFKSVNDTYGHQSGNELLCALAKLLEGIIGHSGVTARYGGEEFIILLPDAEKQEVFRLAEFIRLSIAHQPFTVHSDLTGKSSEQSISITASLGIATAPMDAEQADSLIRFADKAMYLGAKQAGRNKVAVYGA